MSVLVTAQLLAVTGRWAPRLLTLGQGYEHTVADPVAIELAWYRESQRAWMLSAAVESNLRRVQTPPDTLLEVASELTPTAASRRVAQELTLLLADMADASLA